MGAAPEPQEIYERTREEGQRRLSRPLLELAATAIVGGFDVAFGVAALGLTEGALEPRIGSDAAHLAGAIAFGIGFVFVVVGRSELFTENFLVPLAGLERRSRRSWLKLGELWAATLVLNIAAGALLGIVLTSHGVLRQGTDRPLVRLGERLVEAGAGGLFPGAPRAGAPLKPVAWVVGGAPD